MRNLLVGIGASLIATGIGWYFKGPNAGLVIGGVGVAICLIAYFFGRRPDAHSVTPTQQIRSEINPQFTPQFSPTFSPQQNVFIGTHDGEAERERKERDRHDQMIFEHIKQQHEHRPNMTHLVADVASAVSLTFYETDQSLKRLFTKGMLYRSGIDAPGDFVYWFRGAD